MLFIISSGSILTKIKRVKTEDRGCETPTKAYKFFPKIFTSSLEFKLS